MKDTGSNSKIVMLLLAVYALLAPARTFAGGFEDLTGIWKCDDGGTYQMRMTIREDVSELFWYGKGEGWQNVFHGINNSPWESRDFVGRWADVPPFGAGQNQGTITVRVQGSRLIIVGDPNNFRGRTWSRF
jgi:hypothetical protein